jgi:hypothetical protein
VGRLRCRSSRAVISGNKIESHRCGAHDPVRTWPLYCTDLSVLLALPNQTNWLDFLHLNLHKFQNLWRFLFFGGLVRSQRGHISGEACLAGVAPSEVCVS